MPSNNDDQVRAGEIVLPFDPGARNDGPRCVFIGHVRSPWKSREKCPRTIVQARARMQAENRHAELHLDTPYRPGLAGLAGHAHIVMLTWMHQAARHIIVQRPRHMAEARGVFSLRSPARPNPVAVATVRVLDVDMAAGVVRIDATDCVDGTPLIDIRPWYADMDVPPDWRG